MKKRIFNYASQAPIRKFKIMTILIFIAASTFAQNFTWIRGSNLNGTITGIYGTQSVPSSSNNPGTRHGAATWVDASKRRAE